MPKTGASTIQSCSTRTKPWEVNQISPMHTTTLLMQPSIKIQIAGKFCKQNSLQLKKKVILSSEVFSNRRTPQQLAWIHEFLADFDVKIVVYLRKQDDFLQASYQTLITYVDMTCTFPVYFDKMVAEHKKSSSLDYHLLVNDLFANEFDKENIIVRIYQKEKLYQGDLLKDFSQSVGLQSAADFSLDLTNNNLSFDGRFLEIYRKIKICFKDEPEIFEGARRRLRDTNQREAFLPNNIITHQQSQQLMSLMAGSNSQLACKYFDMEDGKLFMVSDERAETVKTVESTAAIQDNETEALLREIDPTLVDRHFKFNQPDH